uniref:ribonuclease III n=1 Tax=Glossina brevipalpis TaxID=37001 RepID=A0A1A9WDV9_9MUSC
MEESKEKNMKARSYQLELVDYVCQRNGIIYLPTGAGKTFVAILALKRLSASLQHTIAEGGKRAIYMCNTVELARQQCVEVRKCTNFKVGLYVGEREVDNWNNTKWSEEIIENQVLVGTAQIFVDIVTQNLIKISDISVVIIDECHHATKNHPMHTFLSLFQYVDQCQLPRVIGLTGVLVKGNKFKSIQKELNNLEATFRGKIVTINSKEEFNNVMLYSTKPQEKLVNYKRQTREPLKIEDDILSIILECKEVIDRYDIGNVPLKLTKGLAKLQEPNKKKYIKNFLDDFLYQMNDLGLYAASLAIMSVIIEFEVKKRQSETTALRNLYRLVITRCENIRHIIVTELKSMVKDGDIYPIQDSICNMSTVIYKYSTPKLRAFLLSLTSMFKGKKANDISCLVFVERRYTAKCVYYVLLNYLKQTPDLKDVIRPQFMVGRQNISYSIESILDSKWNKSAMDQFRNKECNLIVCSNVLEEGIDVQACNYVFVLDELKTFNSYIQTKGRARSKDAYYTIFCENINYEKVVSKIRSYKETHEEIKEFLSERLLECDDPNQQEVDQQFMELIPPFEIESGARLLATSALMLLYRYCQSLPWDSFGCVMPCFGKLPANSNGAVAVSVTLPLQSTIRETITSDYMHSWRGAKISAAFKACVKLYKEGELNNYLLPVSKTECIAKVSEELFKNWKKYNDDVTLRLVGKSHRRLYERECPKELYAALPQVGQISYAYAIQFFTDFDTNPYNAHVVKYLNNTCTYALMLSKKLPLLAEMPLFMSQGKIRVRISNNPIEFILETKQQLNLLENFHTMIFKDLLQLWKDFLVIDRRNLENSYLLVPLNSTQSIDWQLVEDFQRIEPAKSYSITERRRNAYRPEDYLDKVVTKWYTKNDDERYVVVKVRQDLNPLSQFDNNQFQNYMEFYQSRYNINVADNSQFLLEVKALTKQYFGIVKSDSDIRLPNLLDLRLDSTQLRANTSQREVDGFLVNCDKLEQNLAYKFRDRAYLLQAITHPSFPTNRLTGCYQELEFIGDAILDMLVTCYIFERYQSMTPGMMTDMRMALVNNITLGCICVRHRFHLFMLYENSALSEAIRLFADFQETQQQRVTDQVRILMEEYRTIDSDFEDDSDDSSSEDLSFSRDESNAANRVREDMNLRGNFNIASNVDVPKALGDVVEALIAAVYLDSRDLQTTWRVIYGLLENEFIEFSSKLPIDPVRELMENKGADAKFSKPIQDNDVVMIKCEFNCLDKSMEANGFGSNAKQAKKAAAKAALRILSKHAN